MDNYTEWMRERTSWRTYQRKELEKNDRERIMDFIDAPQFSPFGNKPRFKLIDNADMDEKIGTYGFIRGAQNFIVGAAKRAPMSMEDYGYVFEKLILYLTGLGLGTCWLGGSFTKNSVADALNPGVDEIIPAISPVGYRGDRGLVGKAIRWGAGSRNRKPWSDLFFNESLDSSLSVGDAGRYIVGFEMVRIAPSASNGQPWRLVLDGECVHFYHDEKEYSVFRQLDLGIAMSHFDLANKEQGISGEWSNESIIDPRYVATWSMV